VGEGEGGVSKNGESTDTPTLPQASTIKEVTIATGRAIRESYHSN